MLCGVISGLIFGRMCLYSMVNVFILFGDVRLMFVFMMLFWLKLVIMVGNVGVVLFCVWKVCSSVISCMWFLFVCVVLILGLFGLKCIGNYVC